MKKLLAIAFSLLILFPTMAGAQTEGLPKGVKVETIWNNDNHSAFTSIIKYKGRYYCTFREYAGHVFDSEGNALGKIRILSSRNCRKWESVALLSLKDCDLRDPKLSITPDGRMMVIMGGSYYVDQKLRTSFPQVSFSSDGKTFTDPQATVVNIASSRMHWIWRVTWHGDTGYGVSYFKMDDSEVNRLALLKTTDGIHYDLVTMLDANDFPNEATVRFLPDGRMAVAIRRDGSKEGDMLWGVSSAPYTQWNLQRTGFKIGGPDVLVLDEDHIVVCGRSYNPTTTSIWTGTSKGDFRKVMDLPAMGDCSYPGLVRKGRNLIVSYYTSYDERNLGKTEIRLAKVPMKLLFEQ